MKASRRPDKARRAASGTRICRFDTTRIANLASINSKDVGDLPVPRPSVADQQTLLKDVKDELEAGLTSRTDAIAIRQSAWTAFESALFTSNESSAEIAIENSEAAAVSAPLASSSVFYDYYSTFE